MCRVDATRAVCVVALAAIVTVGAVAQSQDRQPSGSDRGSAALQTQTVSSQSGSESAQGSGTDPTGSSQTLQSGSPGVGRDVGASTAAGQQAAASTTNGASKPDALALYRDHQYAQAAQVTRDEIAATPRNVDSYVVLGWSLLALGQFQDALGTATKALSFAPYDHRIVEIAGEAEYRLGKYVEALRYFQQYVAIAPTTDNRLIDDVYYFMGEIYISQGQFNHADTALTTAVHYSPNDAGYWDRLGYARELAKENARAADAYRKALALNPALSDAASGLARINNAGTGR